MFGRERDSGIVGVGDGVERLMIPWADSEEFENVELLRRKPAGMPLPPEERSALAPPTAETEPDAAERAIDAMEVSVPESPGALIGEEE